MTPTQEGNYRGRIYKIYNIGIAWLNCQCPYDDAKEAISSIKIERVPGYKYLSLAKKSAKVGDLWDAIGYLGQFFDYTH